MPAPLLATDRLRLRVDVEQKTGASDALRGATPIAWRSADIVFETALFFHGEVVDVSNLAALTIEIKAPGANNTAPDAADDPLASKTVTAFDNSLAAATWTDLSKQHVTVAFTAEEMNFALGGRQYQWMVVSLLTTAGKVLTAAAGVIDIREDGYDSAGTAPTLDGTAYTKAESNALYPLRADAAAAYRFTSAGMLQLKDKTTGLWRTLFLDGGALNLGPEVS